MTDTKAVLPAEGTGSGSVHWIRSDIGRRSKWIWKGGQWECGQKGQTIRSPIFAGREGWTYVGPVQEPVTEGGDG